MAKDKNLMLTKEEISNAIKESEFVKIKYPAFWKFYEMIMDMNNELMKQQMSMEVRDGQDRKKR